VINLFAPEKPLDINGPSEYHKIPNGWFRILLANKKERLGYKPAPIVVQEKDEKGRVVSEQQIASPFGIMFGVRECINLGGREIVLDQPRRKLPLVRLNYFASSSAGLARIGGTLVMDTEQVRQPDGFDFDTSDPAGPMDGVDYA